MFGRKTREMERIIKRQEETLQINTKRLKIIFNYVSDLDKSISCPKCKGKGSARNMVKYVSLVSYFIDCDLCGGIGKIRDRRKTERKEAKPKTKKRRKSK